MSFALSLYYTSIFVLPPLCTLSMVGLQERARSNVSFTFRTLQLVVGLPLQVSSSPQVWSIV